MGLMSTRLYRRLWMVSVFACAALPARLSWAAVSTNLTTVTVTNVGPATASAGTKKVPVLSFTLHTLGSDTFRSLVAHYSGNATVDVSIVYLYRESGAVPGSFNSASDTLLTSAANATDVTLNPSDFAVGANSNIQFYIVADVASGAVDGRSIDFEIKTNQITFATGTWPSPAEAAAGTWNPAGSTIVSSPAITIGNASVTEGDAGAVPALFDINLSKTSTETVTVKYATANVSAIAPGDYTATNSTLKFNPGETNKQVTVSVNGDTTDENDETFSVVLSSATNATVVVATGTGTIVDDD